MRPEQEPELKRLRREMADAHPDRDGTNEEFITARERDERALSRASWPRSPSSARSSD
jgi:hypothetical protein